MRVSINGTDYDKLDMNAFGSYQITVRLRKPLDLSD